MVKLASDGSHTFADIAQHLTIGQMAKKKRDEMHPGIQLMAKLVEIEPFCSRIDQMACKVGEKM